MVQSIVSPNIIDELRRILKNKLGFEPDQIESFINILSGHSETVVPRHALRVIKNDPSDDRILECAVEGQANLIVSGDRHLLSLKTFRGISILTVREFINIIHA